MEHHSRFLMGERYKRCWTYSSTDYHHWLMELKRAGYTTAKNYVDVCEKIINKYHLDKYDRMAETSNKKTIGFKYNSPKKGENPNDSCPFFIKADKVTVNQLLRAFSKAGYEARKLKEGEKQKKN